jgi:Uma2 family endonuclease
MSLPALKQDQHYTYADYCTWPEEERWELIDGVAYNMCPAPVPAHQLVVVELTRQIANYLYGKKSCQIFTAPFDVRFPRPKQSKKKTDTVVQPDIAVICDKSKIDDKGCNGAPDWIIEVLSPATASKDHVIKRELYARHGVREYWLVHPLDKILTRYDFTQADIRPEICAAEGETASQILPDFRIHWADVWGDIVENDDDTDDEEA